jgi:hypothetical protein
MYVNFGDNQLGVFDSSNVARDLIGVPVFSASHAYSAGNAVVYSGGLYVALGAVPAGTFNPAQWAHLTGAQKTLSMKFTAFTASGTYIPSAGLVSATLEAIAGGGGGGSAISGGNIMWNGAGGGSGGYSRALKTAAQLGASQAITIGPGGSGGWGSSLDGAGGGDTSIGTLCVAHGGIGGGHAESNVIPAGGAGGAPGTGDIAMGGNAGEGCLYNGNIPGVAIAGQFGRGGPGPFGGGPAAAGPYPGGIGAINGPNGGQYGAGGSGGFTLNNGGFANGGSGANGVAFITEFIMS